MRYTQALEEIYKDHSKVFRACSADGWDAYQLDGTNMYIIMTHGDSLDSPVSFLSYRMMDLDWKEWDGNEE